MERILSTSAMSGDPRAESAYEHPPMPQDATAKPLLSIVIACREPWPALRRALDRLHPQAVALGAEIIVAMSDPRTVAPDAQRLYPSVRWLQGGRDDSVFQLRALALPQCRGDLIALTEDHAWVEGNWCRAILEAHAQHPEAAAIGGVVENGATASIIDWAGFFAVNGRFMHPIRSGASDDISLQSNVAYKRRALPETFPTLAWSLRSFIMSCARAGEVGRDRPNGRASCAGVDLRGSHRGAFLQCARDGSVFSCLGTLDTMARRIPCRCQSAVAGEQRGAREAAVYARIADGDSDDDVAVRLPIDG